jgi:hypothetical protein
VAQLVVWNGASLAVDGMRCWCWNGNTTINSISLGDIDGDGQAEVMTGGSYFDSGRNNAQVVVWSGSDLSVEHIAAWCWGTDSTVNSIAAGDVTGDSVSDIVSGGYFNDGTYLNSQLTIWGMT